MSFNKLINPASIALLYLIAGVVWILFSDNWVAGLTDNPELLTTMQTYKGWVYVVVTAIPLYLLVNLYKQSILKHAEELRVTEQHYEELFLNNPNPTAVVQRESLHIVAHNLNFGGMLGYSAAELSRLKLTDLILPSELDMLQTYLKHSDSQIPEIIEFRKKNGSQITLELTYRRMEFYHSSAFLFQFRDVTAELINKEQVRKLTEHLEREVALRTRDLEITNEELEAFTYSVSHDLKAPVRAVQSFSEAIHHDTANSLSESSNLYLKRVRNAADKMAQLIDDLLRLSKVTQSGLEMEHVDMSELVREAVANMNNGNIHVDLDSDIYAYADKRLFKIMFDNLLSNAIKFSSKVPHPKIEVGCTPFEDRLEFYIKDNGIGIHMDQSKDLFRPFRRLVQDDEYPGFGIGLAVVRRIINRHGGTVKISSKPGMGATFYIGLPR
ncbi:MAG: PAS domain S-box protein [Bacteroidetes bacterium]|nr:PAS domain S-box protein [Bacteroidota bacterium]